MAALAGVFGAIAWTLRDVNEDAYFFLRMVDVLLHGGGLSYNPGERQEANTDFLWTLLLVPGPALGVDPVLWMHLAGMAVYLAGLLATYALARLVFPAAWHALLALALLGLQLPFAKHAASGFGMGLLALACVCALLALARLWRRPDAVSGCLLGASLTFMALCRLDSVVLGLPVLGCALWAVRRGGPSARRAGAVALGIPALACTALLLWKWSYYGDVFPAPYYIKGPDSYAGVDYLGEKLVAGLGLALSYWAKGYSLPLALGAAGGLWIARGRLREGTQSWKAGGPVLLAAAGMTVLWHIYVVRSGGDTFTAGFRFYAAPAPMLSLLFTWGLVRLPKVWRWALIAVAALAFGDGVADGGLDGERLFPRAPDSVRQPCSWARGGAGEQRPFLMGFHSSFMADLARRSRYLCGMFAHLGHYPGEVRLAYPFGGYTSYAEPLLMTETFGFADARIGRAKGSDALPVPIAELEVIYKPGHRLRASPMLLARLGVNLMMGPVLYASPDFDSMEGVSRRLPAGGFEGGQVELPPRQAWAMWLLGVPVSSMAPHLRLPPDSQLFALDMGDGRHLPGLYFNRNATIGGILDARGIERFDVYP